MRIFTRLIIALMLAGTASAAERPAKPNIVLILADDLDWQDVKRYDIDEPCPMETPAPERTRQMNQRLT